MHILRNEYGMNEIIERISNINLVEFAVVLAVLLGVAIVIDGITQLIQKIKEKRDDKC